MEEVTVYLKPMDLLQAALIFLILLLSIFLAITGFQVFFILRDLKKALDRLNRVLQSGEIIAEDIEKPITATSNLVTGSIEGGAQIATSAARALGKVLAKSSKPKSKRFYKKVL